MELSSEQHLRLICLQEANKWNEQFDTDEVILLAEHFFEFVFKGTIPKVEEE